MGSCLNKGSAEQPPKKEEEEKKEDYVDEEKGANDSYKVKILGQILKAIFNLDNGEENPIIPEDKFIRLLNEKYGIPKPEAKECFIDAVKDGSNKISLAALIAAIDEPGGIDEFNLFRADTQSSNNNNNNKNIRDNNGDNYVNNVTSPTARSNNGDDDDNNVTLFAARSGRYLSVRSSGEFYGAEPPENGEPGAGSRWTKETVGRSDGDPEVTFQNELSQTYMAIEQKENEQNEYEMKLSEHQFRWNDKEVRQIDATGTEINRYRKFESVEEFDGRHGYPRIRPNGVVEVSWNGGRLAWFFASDTLFIAS